MSYPALDPARLRAVPGWRVELTQQTASTNADVIERARAGAAEGLVVIAEEQTAGRGRMGRSWVSARGAGVWLTVLLRPRLPLARWGWLPLLTGVALADTVREVTGLTATLKWPNDLLIDGRKCAGILAEVASPGAVAVGVGLNVLQEAAQLPVTATGLPATSLLLAGAAEADRTQLAVGILQRLAQRYESWQHDPRGILEPYRQRCSTIGREVRISLPTITRFWAKRSPWTTMAGSWCAMRTISSVRSPPGT